MLARKVNQFQGMFRYQFVRFAFATISMSTMFLLCTIQLNVRYVEVEDLSTMDSSTEDSFSCLTPSAIETSTKTSQIQQQNKTTQLPLVENTSKTPSVLLNPAAIIKLKLENVVNYYRGINISRRRPLLNDSKSSGYQQIDSMAALMPELEMYPPIDAVITYVNGSDPKFQQMLRQIQRNFSGEVRFSATPNRFQDHNDLKLLLRSLEINGQMFRHIHIVVANERQVPNWLNTKHPKIKIVYHRDIWRNASQLPSFNSLSIEANLHHIKNLSDVFVYFNDDVLPLKPLSINDFAMFNVVSRRITAIKLRGDIPLAETMKTASEEESHWVGPALTTREALKPVCSSTAVVCGLSIVPSHTPHVLFRSVLKHAEGNPSLREQFQSTSASPLRSGRELNTVMLSNIYAQCQFNYSGFQDHSSLDLIYVGVNTAQTAVNYLETVQRLIVTLNERVKQYTSRFLCINDTSDLFNATTLAGLKGAQMIYKWRESLFPAKSSFEL